MTLSEPIRESVRNLASPGLRRKRRAPLKRDEMEIGLMGTRRGRKTSLRVLDALRTALSD